MLNSGRPHDYWILKSVLFIILLFFLFFYCLTALQKLLSNIVEDNYRMLMDDQFLNLGQPLTTRFLGEFS